MNTLNIPLKAQDVMVSEPVCVECSTTLRELARVFEENDISYAPVVDGHGALTGVVSRSALIRLYSEWTAGIPPAHLFELIFARGGVDEARRGGAIPEPRVCVEDFMTRDPITVTPDTPLPDVAKLLLDRRIYGVIVVDEQRTPVGIISSSNLLGVFSQQYSGEHRGRVEPREASHPYHYPWSL